MGTIPAYPDFANGEIVTDTKLDTIKAAGDFWASPPRCSAYLSAAQTLTTAVAAAIGFGAETYDIVQAGDSPMHDNATNNSRIVARTTGKYMISGQVEFASNSTGVRSVVVRLNAAGVSTGGTLILQSVQGAVTANATTVAFGPIEVALTAGDHIEVFGYQTSGGNLALNAGSAQTFLRVALSAS